MLFHRNDKKDKRVLETPPFALGYPKEIEKAPDSIYGVYMFLDSSDEVVFVGKALGKKLKDEIKAMNGADAARGVTEYRWFKTKSGDAASDLEAEWINRYHPRNNEASSR